MEAPGAETVDQQTLVDKLQIVIPLLQRVTVTLRQQSLDVASALAAAEAIATGIRPPLPPVSRDRTSSLELAIVRSGRTTEAIAHLTGIPIGRLTAIIGGAEPANFEEAALRHVLPDWKGGR